MQKNAMQFLKKTWGKRLTMMGIFIVKWISKHNSNTIFPHNIFNDHYPSQFLFTPERNQSKWGFSI